MKLLKKINSREIKRTFVIGNIVRAQEKSGRRYLGKISEEEFKKKLSRSKQKALQMSDKQLDAQIEDLNRLRAYIEYDWYLADVKTSEVGVWRKAGGLPLAWTNDSLKATANKVHDALMKDSPLLAKRAQRAIRNMLATNVNFLQSEKYLLPIIFKSGTGTLGRRRLKRQMKGDIDDGCMRSIALAINGAKVIRVYIGFPKKARIVH